MVLRRLLLSCLFGLGLFFTMAANQLAAQDAVQTDTSNDAEQQADAEDSGEPVAFEDGESNEDEEESSVRFIPTEQISQDLGVSFPVDI